MAIDVAAGGLTREVTITHDRTASQRAAGGGGAPVRRGGSSSRLHIVLDVDRWEGFLARGPSVRWVVDLAWPPCTVQVELV